MNDFSIPIDRVVGTSSGALAAALFASGLDSFQIATGVREIGGDDGKEIDRESEKGRERDRE